MKKKFFIAFVSSFIIFAALYTAAFSFFFTEKPVVASDDKLDDQIIEEEATDDKSPVKNEILFLLMGVDAEKVSKSKGTRTDTMMLTKVNFETGDITLFSIPRDTRLNVNGKLDKVNSAHAIGGPELAVETVGDFLGVDLKYYVKVDYGIVKDVVDAIGGVVVDVPMTMIYRDPTAEPPLNINIKKGVQELDGKNAHDFLRFRHNNDMTVGYPEGDVGRIKTQQYFMKELVKQTLQPKNLLQLPSLIKTYYNNVETNIPLTSMLKGAASASKINVDNINTATVPGVGEYIGPVSYYIYDRDALNPIVSEMFGDYLAD
ncbi:LytR family transcriptional regulator [Tissierella creatinini]|nr:LytR family transcriptional regulator [Tissierella creatinini]TJX67266.1 LytR family transcriptional regulator [Soehngenia saccharolytica]